MRFRSKKGFFIRYYNDISINFYQFMTSRAAIRGVTKGISKPSVIQYMLVDDNWEYIIFPNERGVTDLKTNINDILEELEIRARGDSLQVYYKSINESYGRHREDSGQFHRLIKKLLARKNLLKSNSRLAFFIKKNQLRLFAGRKRNTASGFIVFY